MLLMIDNYDSFTYNLVQYFYQLGQEVEVYRNDLISLNDIEKKSPDFVVISPGPCNPEKAGISVDVVKRFSGKVPILGVCLGHQSIVTAFGGKITRANRLMHGKISPIHHDDKTLFKNLPNPFDATRYHSLIARHEDLPDCFEVSAYTTENEIMGIRHKKLDIEGVQFHPESILTLAGKDLLKNFLQKRPVAS